MPTTTPTSREIPLAPAASALLFVDAQNYCCHPDGGAFRGLAPEYKEERWGEFFRGFEASVLPNMRALQTGFRGRGCEVLYAVIENLTLDGRDRGLDYKISGIDVPRGSWDAQMLDQLAPGPDDIRLPKTSSGVFASTSLDYVLRNLGVRQLVVAGVFTDQCVESTVREACDRGYLVTLATDACAARTALGHESSLRALSGYCRRRATARILEEL